MTKTFDGRCLCKDIKLQVVGMPVTVKYCHCPACRKATASAFASFASFDCSQVSLTGETLQTFRHTPDVERHFCGGCGSPIGFVSHKKPDQFYIYLGMFDEPETLNPDGHLYTRTKLSWVNLSDGLPTCEGLEDSLP